jgi:hypothetical protein
LELYDEAIRLDESNFNAYFRRGLIYLTIKRDLDKAFADSEKMIQMAPLDGYGYWLRGAVYGSRQKLDQAYADYEKAIQLNPKLAQAYYGRGLVNRSNGKFKEALRDFDEAIRLEPRDTKIQRMRERTQFELSQQTAGDGSLSKVRNVSKSTGNSVSPKVAIGPKGEIHLVWTDTTPGNYDIFYSMWNGKDWAEPKNLSRNSTMSIYPTVAVASNGSVHVTWMDGMEGEEIHVLHSTLADSNWSMPENISKAKGISQRPQIAVDGSGIVHIVWFGDQGGFFELYHSQLSKSQWTEPKNTRLVEWRITHNQGWSRKAGMAMGPDGNLHIVWADMEDVPSPYALSQNIRHSRWTGNAWSKPDLVSKYKDFSVNLEDPYIVVEGNGNLDVAWEERESIWYGRFDGTQWSVPRQISPEGIESIEPAISCSDNESLHFAWIGMVNDTTQVFYRRLSKEQWSNSVNISASSQNTYRCAIASDLSGQPHLLWEENQAGQFEIMHRSRLTK